MYGSFRYYGHENPKERKGYYNDDYLDPDIVFFDDDNDPNEEEPARRGWSEVAVEVFRSPNWLLKDRFSNIHVVANTPMYDESLDELRRTLDSYLSVVREYPFLGTSML